MGTRIAARKHVLDQIPREIDVLEKLVRSLPGKDKAAKNEQSQINQFGQALTCAHYIAYAAIALSQRAIEYLLYIPRNIGGSNAVMRAAEPP
jgi:hypothetical protein